MAGDDHGPGGILIDAVDGPEGTGFSLLFAEGRIDAGKGAEDMSARLVYRHPGGLVKDGDVVVPVQAGNVGLAGRQTAGGLRQGDLQQVALLQQVDGACVGAVAQDALRQVLQRNDDLAANALAKAQEVLNLGAGVLGGDGIAKGGHAAPPSRKFAAAGSRCAAPRPAPRKAWGRPLRAPAQERAAAPKGAGRGGTPVCCGTSGALQPRQRPRHSTIPNYSTE